MKEEGNRDALIESDAEPPAVVKCAPKYQRPEWVPWDQGLKGNEGGRW
jgi:hypothetical protein